MGSFNVLEQFIRADKIFANMFWELPIYKKKTIFKISLKNVWMQLSEVFWHLSLRIFNEQNQN